jgi:uncharacterized cupredoxin-like copper-binding protein
MSNEIEALNAVFGISTLEQHDLDNPVEGPINCREENRMKKILIASALTLSLLSAGAFAEENHRSGEGDTSLGSPGDPGKVSRTIEITMVDNHFKPSEINVKQGETVKFMLKNTGKKKHEMMIATLEELDKHAKMMKKFPDMEHPDEPNMITVNPGKTGELVWNFTEAGTVNFSCSMPGHSKSMHGTIEVQAKGEN